LKTVGAECFRTALLDDIFMAQKNNYKLQLNYSIWSFLATCC